MATIKSKIFEAVCEVLLNAQAAAYTPTTPYTGALPSKTVKRKSRGTDVKRLQSFLNWCIRAGLKVDGVCGSKTVSAIKKFQKQYGLKQDGVFGSKSRNKATAIVNAHKPKPEPPKPQPTPQPQTNAQKIAAKAREYAWPKDTSGKITAYKTGYPKSEYKTALKKYMNKSAKVSQTDCGYFVSTCVRASGTASSFLALPANAKKPYPAVPSTMSIVSSGKVGTLKEGDIIRWRKTNNHQHVVIYLGNGLIAHAGREHWFPKIVQSSPWNAKSTKKSTIQVIRAK